MKKNYVVVDAMNKKLLMTKKDYADATKGYGEAYEALCEKMNAHPAFTIEIIVRQTHIEGEKRTYKGLNIEFMSDYITALGVEEDITEFKFAQEFAKSRNMKVFAFTKKWFLGKYNTEEKPFDMEEAFQVIYKSKFGCYTESNAEENTSDEVENEAA